MVPRSVAAAIAGPSPFALTLFAASVLILALVWCQPAPPSTYTVQGSSKIRLMRAVKSSACVLPDTRVWGFWPAKIGDFPLWNEDRSSSTE